MASSPWHRIAERARPQFGVVSARQLLRSGFSSAAISRAVARGHLVRLHRGVYAVGHVPTDDRAALMAAVLLAGDDAVLARQSAAALLGLASNRSGRIWVAGPRQAASPPGVEVRTATFGPGETGRFRGVPCTSPSRTLLDLAAISAALAERGVRAAGDAGLLDVEDLLSMLDRYPGRRGARRLRRAVIGGERVPVFTRSELERRLWQLCAYYGIDRPEMNVDVYAGERLYECDAVWPRWRLIIECDSHWHDNPISGRADAERDELLTLAGWRVFRMRWAQIALRPERAAATIRRLISLQRQALAARQAA